MSIKLKAPLTIIGSGIAGYTVAREFRNLDKETPLRIITADEGVFYSKPLISNALSQQKAASALAMLAATKLAEQIHAQIHTFSTVNAIDTQQQTVSTQAGERWEYSQLVLACGAQPIRLPLAGNAAAQILSVNNLDDYAKLFAALENKQKVIVLGAGLIGCEFANDLAKAGFKVDVVALSATPLDLLLPPALGTVVQSALETLGINWFLNTAASAVNFQGAGYEVCLENGQSLYADVVLSAVGIKPVTHLASAAGINVRRGIVVDAYLQTNVPQVYAVGDCAEVAGHLLQYITPIMRGARALAKTLAGTATAVSYPAMPIVVKTPNCPLVLVLPPVNVKGDWEIAYQQGTDVKALYYDKQGKVQGFILMGHQIPEKTALLKQIPPLLELPV